MANTTRTGRSAPTAVHLCCGTEQRTIRLEPPKIALVICDRCRYRQWYVDGVPVDADTARAAIAATDATITDAVPEAPTGASHVPVPRGLSRGVSRTDEA